MEGNIKGRALGVLFCPLLLIACASGPSQPIATSDRDTTGIYDGQWAVVVERGARRQYLHNSELTCSDMSRNFRLVIDGGEANAIIDGKMRTTAVNDAGQFRFEVPTEYSYDGRFGAEDSNITFVMVGDLSEANGAGRWVTASKKWGNYGCTAPIRYAKEA